MEHLSNFGLAETRVSAPGSCHAVLRRAGAACRHLRRVLGHPHPVGEHLHAKLPFFGASRADDNLREHEVASADHSRDSSTE